MTEENNDKQDVRDSRPPTAFRVYNCPNKLINEYIAYAKLYCDNQVWKVMELAFESLKSKKVDIDYVNEMHNEFRKFILSEIQTLIQRLDALENKKIELPKKDKKEISTFGSK